MDTKDAYDDRPPSYRDDNSQHAAFDSASVESPEDRPPKYEEPNFSLQSTKLDAEPGRSISAEREKKGSSAKGSSAVQGPSRIKPRGILSLLSSTRKRRKEEAYLARKRNNDISEFLERHGAEEASRIRCLMLGSAGSGTSSLFREIRFSYGDIDTAERMTFRPMIYSDVVKGLKALCDKIQQPHVSLECEKHMKHVQVLETLADQVRNVYLDANVVPIIGKFWSGIAIQERAVVSQDHRDMTDLCDIMNRMSSTGYVPTDKDILRVYLASKAVHQFRFRSSNGRDCVINELPTHADKKVSFHLLHGLDRIIFVANISSYDDMLSYEPSVNALAESLIMFDAMVNSRWYADIPFILIFSKVDRLKEHILSRPIKKQWPDFTGAEADIGDAKAYFAKRFGALDRRSAKHLWIIFGSIFEGRSPAAMVEEALDGQWSEGLLSAARGFFVIDGTEPEESPDAIHSWEQVQTRVADHAQSSHE